MDRINRWCLPQFVPARDLMLISCDAPRNIVKLFRRSDGLLLKELDFPGQLHTLSFSRDSRFVVGAGWEGKVRVWDLTTFEPTDLLEGSGPYGARAQFSPHEDILVLGQAATRQLSLVRTGTWKPLRRVHMDAVWQAFTFSRTQNLLDIGGTGRVLVWKGDLTGLKWSIALAMDRAEKIEHLVLSPDESAIFGYCG